MKKLSYIAVVLAAACLLPGCSDDNNRVSNPQAGNANDLQAIELNVSNGNNFTAATRGAGIVGGVSTPDGSTGAETVNLWKKQNLWVLMRHSGTTNEVVKADLGYQWTGIPETLLNNQHLIAPNGETSGQVTCVDDAPYYYYPVEGNYDFYAYHVDDAANNQQGAPTTVPTIAGTGSDYEYVEFTIDGTQDLMAAKADFYTDVVNSDATPEQKAELAGVTEEKDENGVSEPISYSAFAARRTVQPTLVFKHLLTKLNFYVVNMNEPAADATEISGVTDREGNAAKPAGGAVIDVTGITIVKTATKGQLVVTSKVAGKKAGDIIWTAYNGGSQNGGTDPADAALQVKQLSAAPGVDVDLEALTAKTVDYPIGEGLLLQPIGAANYEGSITFKQTLNTEYNGAAYDTEEVSQTVPFTIKASDIKDAVEGVEGFAAGYAYNIYLKVYGVQEIKIEAVLTPWIDGGDVTTTPEDDVFGPTDITAQKKKELDAIFAVPETEDDYIALLNWAEKYYVSAKELATIRPAYNLDGDEVDTEGTYQDVDAADWAAFRLQTKLNAEATAETRATIKETAYVEGYNALIEYLNNTTITSADGAKTAKTAEYTPSASCAYTLTCVESESAYFTSEPQSVNEALQLVQEAKENKNAGYDKEDALVELATRMEGNLTTCTEAGCEALLWYMTAQEDNEETTDVNEAKIAYPITAEDEIFTTYAIYKYQDAITPAGVTAIKAILAAGDTWPEASTEPEEPAFAITKSYAVIDEATFNSNLPDDYRTQKPWDVNSTPASLPWLCVQLAENTPVNELEISITAPDGETTYTEEHIDQEKWGDLSSSEAFDLLTFNAEELGLNEPLSSGTWTVTINSISVQITIPASEPTVDEGSEEGQDPDIEE